MKLFISYSRDDSAWVYELWRALRDRAHHDVWIDQRLVPAQDWWETILTNIADCEAFVYVMTPRSIESIYCEAELGYALALNKPIIPLMLKPCDAPADLRQRRIQHHTITAAESLFEVLFVVGQSLGEIRVAFMQGKYPRHDATPPAEPKPRAERIVETYKLGVLAMQ